MHFHKLRLREPFLMTSDVIALPSCAIVIWDYSFSSSKNTKRARLHLRRRRNNSDCDLMCGDVDVCMEEWEHLHFVFEEKRFNESISWWRKQKQAKDFLSPDSSAIWLLCSFANWWNRISRGLKYVKRKPLSSHADYRVEVGFGSFSCIKLSSSLLAVHLITFVPHCNAVHRSIKFFRWNKRENVHKAEKKQ